LPPRRDLEGDRIEGVPVQGARQVFDRRIRLPQEHLDRPADIQPEGFVGIELQSELTQCLATAHVPYDVGERVRGPR